MQAWGIGKADMVQIVARLGPHGYLQAFDRTTEIVMNRFGCLASVTTIRPTSPCPLTESRRDMATTRPYSGGVCARCRGLAPPVKFSLLSPR